MVCPPTPLTAGDSSFSACSQARKPSYLKKRLPEEKKKRRLGGPVALPPGGGRTVSAKANSTLSGRACFYFLFLAPLFFPLDLDLVPRIYKSDLRGELIR